MVLMMSSPVPTITFVLSYWCHALQKTERSSRESVFTDILVAFLLMGKFSVSVCLRGGGTSMRLHA